MPKIEKTGIVSASGGDVRPNLLAGSHITLKQTTDGTSMMTYTCPDLSQLKSGTVLTVSVDIEVYNVNTMRRIGCEPSFIRTAGGTDYIGVWTTDKTNRKERIYRTLTLGGDASRLSQNGIYIQDITFNTGGYIILSNPKLEIGSTPTAWCPNVNDDYYVNSGGFIERSIPPLGGTLSQIYSEHFEAMEFIEI